jgi:hypothetical protein
MSNLRKKYVKLIEMMDKLDPIALIEMDPRLLNDLFNGTFDDQLMGSSVRLIDKMFKKIYLRAAGRLFPTNTVLSNAQNVSLSEEVLPLWVDAYISALESNKQLYYLNTSQALNKAIVDVRPQSVIVVIRHLCEADPQFQKKHIIWGIVSLLRFAKLQG